MFKKEHWIRIVYGRCQQSFGIVRKSRVYHFKPGPFGKPGFIGLRVERTGAHSCTTGHPDDDIRSLVPAIMHFCQVIDDRVKPLLTKSANCISTIAFIPLIERPMAADITADSQMGVLRTLSVPKASAKPSVTLKTPPYPAISCPMSTSLG